MRLSEAMRLGAMLRPRQSFSVLYETENDATCAFGAAAHAVGLLDTSQRNCYVEGAMGPHEWRWLTAGPFTCPKCRRRRSFMDGQLAIFHMNNYHRWTREAIADWVATIEPPDAIAETLAPVLVTKQEQLV